MKNKKKHEGEKKNETLLAQTMCMWHIHDQNWPAREAFLRLFSNQLLREEYSSYVSRRKNEKTKQTKNEQQPRWTKQNHPDLNLTTQHGQTTPETTTAAARHITPQRYFRAHPLGRSPGCTPIDTQKVGPSRPDGLPTAHVWSHETATHTHRMDLTQTPNPTLTGKACAALVLWNGRR